MANFIGTLNDQLHLETLQLPLDDMFPLLSPNEISINGLLKTAKLKPPDAFIKSASDRVD